MPSPEATFRALDEAMAQAIGHRLFTVLLRHADASERCYTNQPVAYPVGGRKAVTPSDWTERVFVRRQPYIGRDAADIRAVFFDHELIASLACASVLNLPVVWDGRVLGTMNLLAGARHYGEADIPRLEPFAALLIAPFLQAIDADPDKG